MQACLNHEEIKKRLDEQSAELRRLRVSSLRLFGSFARGSAGPDSDVDMLVEFEGTKTFKGYMRTKLFLEELLGRPVDLATEPALRPELRDNILKEAVRVA